MAVRISATNLASDRIGYLFYLGSPQSKEGDDRREDKLDKILALIDPKNADSIIKELDTKYPWSKSLMVRQDPAIRIVRHGRKAPQR